MGRNDAHGTAKLDGQPLDITAGSCFSDPFGQLTITLWGPDPGQKANATLYHDAHSHLPVVQRATVSNNGLAVGYQHAQRLSKAGIPTDAEVTETGNTFAITGTGSQPGTSSGTPFEITATCA
jgi:hypothetical protein